MQSPENVSDDKRISGSAAVQKNVLSRVVSVWRFFVGLVVFWLAFSMQFACSLQTMFRMIKASAAVRLSKETCYHVSYPFGVFSWVWWFWSVFSMQFACSLQKMFRMLRESAAGRLSKKTCYLVSYPFGVFSWAWSFWLAFSMQFACSFQKMFRMLRESAAVQLSKPRVITCRIRLTFFRGCGRLGQRFPCNLHAV